MRKFLAGRFSSQYRHRPATAHAPPHARSHAKWAQAAARASGEHEGGTGSGLDEANVLRVRELWVAPLP